MKTDGAPNHLSFQNRYRMPWEWWRGRREWWSLMAVSSEGWTLYRQSQGRPPANGCGVGRGQGFAQDDEGLWETRKSSEASILIAPRWRLTIQSLIYAIKIPALTPAPSEYPSIQPPPHTHTHIQLPLIGWSLGAGKAFNCLWLSCFPFSCFFFRGMDGAKRVTRDKSSLKNGNKSIDCFVGGKTEVETRRSNKIVILLKYLRVLNINTFLKFRMLFLLKYNILKEFKVFCYFFQVETVTGIFRTPLTAPSIKLPCVHYWKLWMLSHLMIDFRPANPILSLLLTFDPL